MTKLRPYQKQALDEIREAYRKKLTGVVLHLATGAGKTVVFCDLLKIAYAKGTSAIMVVRGKQLVHQASVRLTREGVPHGIYQGSNTENTHERILVCSVDTLYARREAPRATLLVIDECHLSQSEGWRWLLARYPTAFKLGVSATPHHRSGMASIGDKIVYPCSINDLIRDGYLVGGRYFVPYVPNLRGVKKTGGDFNAKELGKRARDDEELTGNCAKIWSENLRGKSTLVYAVSVAHAEVLLDALREKGARSELITAKTKDKERREFIGRLENGDLDALVSVGVLTTGVDIPTLRAILCCRPTDSYNLWVQILGRGTRPSPGKENFLCYDLSGNLLKHGPIEAERIANLEGLPEEIKIRLKLCKACYATVTSDHDECPECGASLVETRERETGERLHGLTGGDKVYEYVVRPWELELPKLVDEARKRGWRKGAIYHRIKAKYGDESANEAWPRIRALKKWPVKARVTTPA